MAKLTNIESQAKGFFKFQSIDEFIPNLLQVALIAGSIVSLIYLLVGGIEYIMSGGNQERAKTAKSMISSAVTGLVLLAIVWVLWRIINYFLGISGSVSGPIKFKIPTP